MGRQKRYPGAEKSINAFYASVSEAYNHPGADEKSRDGRKPQALLAEEFGISRLKVRKILITTRDVVYPETKRIQELLARGMKKQNVCEYLNMAISTLNSFLPYEKGVYNLAEVSIYAESSRIYDTMLVSEIWELKMFLLLTERIWEGSLTLTMTEEQIKLLCKWLIENSSRPLTNLEKEALKQAVDSSKNWEELITVALLSRTM